ncbi:Z-ring formation inhibitor MciZ [Geomicrobium sp. JCM 19039]|nr:Z-ring formation inhibitor MciZ [Geomicrobium sp. JCM 19039]
MKVYVQPKQVIIQGKSWQVLYQLKKYQKHYRTVQEWCEATQSPTKKQ